MQKINIGRLMLAGIVAAVLLDLFEFLSNGILLGAQWADSLKALGVPPLGPKGIVAFNLWSVLVAFITIWLYVAIRPRFGPGPKTALIAAAVIWLIGWPLGMVAALAMHTVPRELALYSSLLGIPEMAIAILVGAALYKEEPATAGRTATAAS